VTKACRDAAWSVFDLLWLISCGTEVVGAFGWSEGCEALADGRDLVGLGHCSDLAIKGGDLALSWRSMHPPAATGGSVPSPARQLPDLQLGRSGAQHVRGPVARSSHTRLLSNHPEAQATREEVIETLIVKNISLRLPLALGRAARGSEA
jgi:hypothetical protein